ncbi:hypothetical protein [Arcicella rigui]|uniref:hypothetical protein n=1 Tax=Arcicella rigui TaxID=797020 RepID=UPI0038994FF0
MAGVLIDLGEYKEAIVLVEKAYRVIYKHLGEQHPYTKIAWINLHYIIQESKKQL